MVKFLTNGFGNSKCTLSLKNIIIDFLIFLYWYNAFRLRTVYIQTIDAFNSMFARILFQLWCGLTFSNI